MKQSKHTKHPSRLLDQAFAVRGIAPRERFVLIWMARLGNGSGRCWASQRTLAEYTGYSRKTVGRAIGKLQEANLIIEFPDADRCTKTYLITCGKEQGAQGKSVMSGATDRPEGMRRSDAQNPKLNQNKNQRRLPSGRCAQPIGSLAERVVTAARIQANEPQG